MVVTSFDWSIPGFPYQDSLHKACPYHDWIGSTTNKNNRSASPITHRSLLADVEGREDAASRLISELEGERDGVRRRGEDLERAERSLLDREGALRKVEEALQARELDLLQMVGKRSQGMEQLLQQQVKQ